MWIAARPQIPDTHHEEALETHIMSYQHNEAHKKDAWIVTGLAIALAAVFVTGFAITLLRTAWACDDAFISFRTVDNFVNGYGLRWNVNERVQAFTNPLWVFVMTGAYFFTREMFFTPIVISMAVTLAAIGIMLAGVARSQTLGLLGLTVLLFSRGFMDYSTSGLENPLTHLLLAVFMVVFFQTQRNHVVLFLMSLIAALAALNRLDTILFYVPALAYGWLGMRSWKATAVMALGFLPLIAWEVFSVIYYGFPFPNTAYAKLGNGITQDELVARGLRYFQHTLIKDPITLPAIALGMALPPLLRRDGRYLALSFGIALYLIYIVRIGGDFMAGRFFAAPLFLAVLAFVRMPLRGHPVLWAPAFALAALVSLSQPNAPITTGKDFGKSTAGFKDAYGVSDERRWYYQAAGLQMWTPERPLPHNKYANQGRQYHASGQPVTAVHGSIGFRAFLAGPKAHIIDYYALSDPLLARLPAQYDPQWRYGHFRRYIPDKYPESSASGVNTLTDKNLAAYYDQLLLITRGPIWSRDRWAAIWRMNLGRFDHLIDRDRYRFPAMRRVRAEQIAQPMPAGLPWDAEGVTRIPTRGLHIDLDGTWTAPRLELSLEGHNRYEVLFMRGTDIVAKTLLGPETVGQAALTLYAVTTPDAARHGGYSALRIMPLRGDNRRSLGHLRVLGQ